MTRTTTAAALLVAVAAAGCGSEGRGTLSVEIWGEEFVEEGIPAEVFSDGWSVAFERFLVAVDGISAARGDSPPDLVDDTQRVFALTEPGPVPVVAAGAPAGRYDNASYRLAPARAEAVAGNASETDLSLMRDEGYAVFAAGTATMDGQTKTFAWGFAQETIYSGCHSEASLADGEAATVQLTIHADHLFYDDLFAEDPAVTFDVLAEADSDGDGEVTPEELAAYDIAALPNYGTGSEDVADLWAFIGHLIGTLGHIDGEGHCHSGAHEH